MRRRTLALVLVLVAPVLSAWAAPASAAKPCTRGKTLFASEHVRVYEFRRPGLEIGQAACLRGKRRRPNVLAVAGIEDGGYASDFRAQGFFLAYVVRDAGSKGGGPGTDQVEVRDMRTGARIHHIRRIAQRDPSFVLAPSGAVAVLAAGGQDPTTARSIPPAVIKSDAEGRAVIAEGEDIDVASLAHAGDRLYWMQGGSPRTYALK